MNYSNEKVKFELTKIGLKSKPPFICTNGCVKKDKHGNRIVEIQNCTTKEKLTRHYGNVMKNANPWSIKKNSNTVVKEISNFGLKSKPPFICIDGNFGKNRHGERLVKVQNCITKEILTKEMSKAKAHNPWGGVKKEKTAVEKILSQIGLKSNPPFTCTNGDFGRDSRGERLVQLQNINTKEKITRTMNNIKIGQNPWNSSQNRVELYKIHPLYIKLFKKHKIPFKYNFRLGRKIIDFVIKIKNNKKWTGLEIKQSEKDHGYNSRQIANYKKVCKLKQYSLKEILVSDPKGIHKKYNSISIKQLEKLISN